MVLSEFTPSIASAIDYAGLRNIASMGKLEGKVAVVTGAASGLGRASAIRFAKEGAAVVAADLNSQGGELLVSEIAATGGRSVYQRTDVTSESDIKALIDR